MLLSIIPSCGSDDSNQVKKQKLNGKRFSFSSPFGQIAKNKITTDASHDNQVNKKIGIHVAGPEVLLPLIDRPKEVQTLLQNTESGISIFQQLQKVHLPYSNEWQTIQQTLFERNRDDISDREWLKELHSIIFPRSPRLWCHFSECIGARDVRFDEENFDDLESSTMESEDVCTSDSVVQLPTFEFLKQLPSTYRKPVDQIDTVSIDDCHYAESVDEMTNSLTRQEVRNISNESSESFLGLRIRLRSQSESNDGQGNISPLSIGSNADTGLGIRSTSVRSRTRSSSTLLFQKQRRLSHLFLSAPISSSSPIEIPQKSLHGRHRSASSKGESELFAGEEDAATHQWYRQFRQRDLECGRTEPVSLLLNRNPTWQSFASPSSQIVNDHGKSANMEGLLPDGRTRHPSAGSGELKASLATFRKDNQSTATSSSESSSPISIGLCPSASMQVEVDNSGNCLRWPSNEILPISPITDSSDRSMPQTPGESHTILSPMTAFTPVESAKEVPYTENATFGSFSDPLSTVLRSRNLSQPKQAPSTVIFPVPPCAQISRVSELINQLDQQNIVGNENEKSAVLEAFTLLKNTIGSQGIHQLHKLIRTAGERDSTTDEDLLRSIASNCFGLVDMDLAIENGGKILCGLSSFDDKHKRLEAEQKMKEQPWYTLQYNLTTTSSNNQDQIQQTDQDHEARVQTYYEDVDAYAKRFIAFDALLSTIWNVDCTIMHTVRQRCGPVGHFDYKQHKQTTMDKYLTKTTY